MSTKYSSNIISLVKGLMEEDQYKDLMGPPLKKEIIKKVESITDTFPYKFDKDDKEFIVKKVLISLRKTMSDGNVLIDNSTFNPWYKSRQGEIKDEYWNDYKKFLVEKEDWTIGPQGTVSSLDRSTETILSLCSDPKLTSRTSRRGMVVGNVQSGKTSNYIGLITKAADAGYKVIIIIAGMLEELRKQTQIRVEESFIGKDIYKNLSVGVGVFTERSPEKNPNCDTNRNSDFRKTNTQNSSNLLNTTATAPYILVVKKNVSTLDNINLWLDGMRINNDNNIVDLPMILIDDEADNASIDLRSRSKTKKKNKPSKNKESLLYPEEDPSNYDATRINAGIRKILKNFRVSTYVGYTATPFANIFISPVKSTKMYSEDLFPKHFIQYIKPPSMYFGPSKIFLENKFPKLFKYIPLDEINGYEENSIPRGHKKTFRLNGLPKSLKDAIHSFLIATSIRKIREGGMPFHSSMLVNPSTFTNVQISVKSKIQDYIGILNQQLSIFQDSFLISDIKDIWDNDFNDLHTSHDWDSVLNNIKELIQDIKVVVVNNSKKTEKLDYDKYEKKKKKVIVVGGFSLSRGLTLEGLITSYYLRYSKMYDSMLQMGRWFGYRIDYEDICRLYLSKDSHEDFEVISNALEELSVKFEEMQAINATPMKFGLQVRADAQNKRLAITANNKMGAAQKALRSYSYSGRLVQNYCFDRSKISDNLKAVDDFHGQLLIKYSSKRFNEGKDYVFRNINGSLVLDLLNDYQISALNDTITKDTLLKYFKARLQYELKNWHVIFDSNINSRNGIHNSSGVKISRVGRQVTTKTGNDPINLKKTIFLSKPTNRAICSPNITEKVFSDSEKNFKINPSLSKKMFGQVLANKYKTPVLVIAFCKPTFNSKENDIDSVSIQKEIESISTIASINFLFPYSVIPEKLVEVFENAEITDLYGNNSSYVEDGDD